MVSIWRSKTGYALFLLILFALGTRLLLALTGNFYFGWDFGRDMLWVRQLTVAHRPMLVGAWGSLTGAYFGPLYFYLLSVPLLIGQGDPRAAVVMVTVFLTALIPLAYVWGRRRFSPQVAWMWALLFAVTPMMLRLSDYSFPQQLIPFVTFLLILCEWELIRHPAAGTVFMSWFIASLFFHFEPADTPYAYLSVAGVCLYLQARRHYLFSFRSLAAAGLGLILPLIPNLLFDVRHGYSQSRAFWQLLIGADQSLGGSLPLWARLIDRPRQFVMMSLQTFFDALSPFGLGLLLLGLGWIHRYRHRITPVPPFLLLLTWNVGVMLVYFLIFPRLLKDYYLYVIPVLSILGFGYILGGAIARKAVKPWPVYLGCGLVFSSITVSYMVKCLSSPQADTYRIQQQVVDAVYRAAEGQPFNAYSYTPVVYDYAYQYVFTWYGYRQYGYIPATYAYQPNQPDYVADKTRYDQGKSHGLTGSPESISTFLILDPGDHSAYSKAGWLGGFSHLKLAQETMFPSGVRLQVRHP